MKLNIIMVLLLLLSISAHTSYACFNPSIDVTWTGSNSSDWNDAGNYSGNFGFLPDGNDRVIVDADSYTNAPVVSSASSYSPGSIVIRDGANLTVNAALATDYIEVYTGNSNAINVNNAITLTVNADLLMRSNSGGISLSGAGDIDIGGDLVFEANAITVTNYMSGNIDVGDDLIFEGAAAELHNSGTISITDAFTTATVAATANRVYNYSGGILNIGGDINLNGAANFIDNDGTINQSGNFSGILGSGILFTNKSTGTWNWTYTAGTADADMVTALDADGTVIYGGAGNQNIIPVTYKNLSISGSGTKQLQAATAVAGNLDLTGGHIALNDADLTLQDGASINNASASGFIIANGNGKLIQNNIGPGGRTGDVVFPVGVSLSSYTPLTINNSGTADNYSVSMTSAIYDNGWSGTAQTSDVVNRTWFIEEEVIGGSDVALTFQWNASEQLSGFSPTETKVIHYNGAEWEIMATGAASGAGPYSMSASGITSFSPFGIEGTNGVLPVELLYFKAQMQEGTVELDWSTASELNNDYFTIERTTDLENFDAVAKVNGNGTTEDRHDYRFYDKNPSSGVSYYRLKQTDFDGAYTYSDIVKIMNEKMVMQEATPEVNIYPVPSKGEYLKLQISGLDVNKEIPVLVYNIHGQVVYQQSLMINSEEVTLSFPEKLPGGMYTVRINTQEPLVRHFAVR